MKIITLLRLMLSLTILFFYTGVYADDLERENELEIELDVETLLSSADSLELFSKLEKSNVLHKVEPPQFVADSSAKQNKLDRTYVVVPNRSSSSVTIVANDASNKVLRTIGEAELGFSIEPIYASHLWRQKLVVVSDRRTSTLLFFDDATFKYLGRMPASNGLFHTWPSGNSSQLFVTADIDNHIDVFRIYRFKNHIFYRHRIYDVNAIVPNGTPHDIVADYNHFYIGVRIPEESRGVLLKANNRSLKTVGSIDFSFDVHLGIPLASPFLLVAESVEDQLNLVDRRSFEVVSTLDGVTGAHGLWWNSYGTRIFVSDFNSTGPFSLLEINRKPGQLQMDIVDAVDLPDTKAHNMTGDFSLGRLYVTHSGPGNSGGLNTNVSVINIEDAPVFVRSVTTGVNPLGILLVDRGQD